MPRNSTVEEGERISIYISKEVKEHLLGVSNISEHIRNLILEATDAGDKVKITKEIVELKERRLRIEADLMELDAMIAKQTQQLDKITRNEEYLSQSPDRVPSHLEKGSWVSWRVLSEPLLVRGASRRGSGVRVQVPRGGA